MGRQRANLDKVGQRRLRKLVRIHVAAIRAKGGEANGILEAQVPGSRGAHRHPAQDNPAPVDVVAGAHGFDRLEDVGLAGPTEGVLYSPERVQLDPILFGRDLASAVAVEEAA